VALAGNGGGVSNVLLLHEAGTVQMEYRVYFLSHGGLIDSPARGFEAEDDRAALEIARGLYRSAEWGDDGFELWQGARCLHTELGHPGGDA
jgi:hypothetical protein